jgi:D-alanyl-D-alanine carboxypeptidase/D-alanyl-D-alanine-endopeptidase (penicillin-binding protein 4)
MRWSTNLTAEVLGLAATQARGQRPAGLAQSAGAMADWAAERYGIGPAALVDHSGLGDGARLSPAAMVRFLANPEVAAGMRGLMRDQPMRDAAGNPQPNHPVTVTAKTGTLNFVSGLAGYARRGEGRELVFAIFAADLDTRGRIPPALRERPAGGREWSARARRLQQQLIERWTALQG